MEKNINVDIKIDILALLGLVFIILKLVGAIQWSWIWVLSPLWAQLVIGLLIILIMIIIGFIKNK